MQKSAIHIASSLSKLIWNLGISNIRSFHIALMAVSPLRSCRHETTRSLSGPRHRPRPLSQPSQHPTTHIPIHLLTQRQNPKAHDLCIPRSPQHATPSPLRQTRIFQLQARQRHSPGGSMLPAEFASRFPVFNYDVTDSSEVGKWREGEFEWIFEPLAKWLVDGGGTGSRNLSTRARAKDLLGSGRLLSIAARCRT